MKNDGHPIQAEVIRVVGHGGDEIPTYLARPLGAGPYGAVIVLHSAFGWIDGPKEITRTFAVNGYIALMPNLHYRDAPDASPDDAVAVVRAAGGVPDANCMGDVRGSMEYLRSVPAWNRKVGCIGFCSGGRETYLAGCELPIDGGVFCYGGGIVERSDRHGRSERQPVAPIEMTERMSCPTLGLYGREDRNPTPEDAETIAKKLAQHGKPHEFHIYDETGHAYFNAERDTYRPDAVRDSWERIFAFFGEHLASASS